MQAIPPRLIYLLKLLSGAKKPVPVDELAALCSVSRRTVFREIESIAALLEPYGICVGTKVNEGVYLNCSNEGQTYLRELISRNADQPSGRYERRMLILIDLLTYGEAQKLFSYANSFKISEATVSNDLDAIEKKLGHFGIVLIRKPGYGVTVEGNESAIRNAICTAILEIKHNSKTFHAGLGYPPPELVLEMNRLMETRFSQQLEWMTEESREALLVYMTVATERIQSGFKVNEPTQEIPVGFLPLIDFFTNTLELRFSVQYSDNERKNFAVYLSALRQSKSFIEKNGTAARDFLLRSLSYKLIEHFDPVLAPMLKLDDRLVDGLAAHLPPTLVRLKNHVTLSDPLYEEIARSYPDILEKSTRALAALQEYSQDIPDSEASFLATHFGAGMMRMRENITRRIHIGVVCAGGIGTSYFLASQLKKHFSDRAEFEICAVGEVADWTRFDLCVTSVPLAGLPIPMVRVSPLVDSGELESVRLQIEAVSAAEKHNTSVVSNNSLSEQCENTISILSNVKALLENFSVLTVEKDCDFDRLVKLTGYRFGGLEGSGRRIYDDLIKRESMSTQVIPGLELILLHTRTEGVSNPVFSLIVPDGGRFTAPSLQNVRCCVVMLIPFNSSRDTLDMMGRISSALLEDSGFFNAVQNGDQQKVFCGLEKNLKDYILNNINFGRELVPWKY